MIDGVDPYWPKTSIVVDDKEEVSDVLTQMKNEGYDAIKVYEKLTKEVYYEILRVAKEIEVPVVGHVPESVSIRDMVFSGQTSIELLDGYKPYLSEYTQYYSNEITSGNIDINLLKHFYITTNIVSSQQE